MNTYILLRVDISTIVNHIHDIFINHEGKSSIKKHFKNGTAKVNGEWNRQRACSCIT